MAATVGDARKRLEAVIVDRDALVRAWFAQDRGVPLERWDELAPAVQAGWRMAYAVDHPGVPLRCIVGLCDHTEHPSPKAVVYIV